MIKAVLLFLAIPAASIGFTQDQLKNTYNTYSEVYGGTEDSGVSRTETYTFVAYGSVVIKDIYYNGGQLKLNKGDTLRVNVSSNRPYNTTEKDTAKIPAEVLLPPFEKRFEVVKLGAVYYANVQWPYAWPGTLDYFYKQKSYTSRIREGFDSGYTGYAP